MEFGLWPITPMFGKSAAQLMALFMVNSCCSSCFLLDVEARADAEIKSINKGYIKDICG